MKKINKNSTKINLSKISFSDLYNLYSFVSGINSSTFGKRWEKSKETVKLRLKEIEEELYQRAFGYNIFAGETKNIVVEGEDPLKIDLSKFDTAGDAVVVKGK